MKYKYFFLSIVFSLSYYIVQGQTNLPEQTSFHWGGLGYGGVGIQAINFANTDFSIKDQSIYRSNLNLQFGGGGFILLGRRYIAMGQGYGSIYSMQNSDNSDLSITYGGGGINLGYAIINKNRILFFPTIGIGGAGYDLEVQNKSQSSIDFGSHIISENETGQFQLANSYLDLNINFHKLFTFSKTMDNAQGFSLGFSFGYQPSLSKSNWKNLSSDTEVQGLDKNSGNTFYIRLLIGGGGFN